MSVFSVQTLSSLARASLSFLLVAVALSVAGCVDNKPSNPGAEPPAASADAGTELDGLIAETDATSGGSDAAQPIGDAAQPASDATADATPEPEPDYSEMLFALEHLIEVEIELPEAEWDTLRVQERGGAIFVGEDCMEQPFPSPYTWTRATVTIDGERFPETGIRKKGFFGSVSENRPSLKVRFDKFVDDQTLNGIKRMTLNNARQDPTVLRQCLAYEMFRNAGVPAPRCNFAHVVVNGRDLGVYANTEPFKKPFLRRFFEDDTGYLYEGTLSDFREGWTGTIEQKNDEENPYTAPIDALVAAAQADDANLIEALSAVIDLDQFITFWATEVIVAHWDGYSGNTNNFYFYDDPTSERIHFIAHGTDGTFTPPRRLFEGMDAPRSVNAAGLLARRLYLHPEGQQRYLDRLIELLDTHWDPNTLKARVDTMAAVFSAAVLPQQREAFDEGMGELRAFIDDHGGRIRAEVSFGPVEWPFPLRGNLCISRRGTVRGEFTTRWGTHPTQNVFETGGGEAALNIFDEDVDVRRVGCSSGYDREDSAAILAFGMLVDDVRIYFVRIGTRGMRFQQGTFRMGEEDDFGCGFFEYNTQLRRVTFFAECAGSVTFDQPGGIADSFVTGSLDLEVWARDR